MTLKVVQGLVSSSPSRQSATENLPTNRVNQSAEGALRGATQVAKSASTASEAVVTTIRAANKPVASSEVRSPDDAERLARKIAKGVTASEREEEALGAHSGLDAVSRSSKGGSDYLV